MIATINATRPSTLPCVLVAALLCGVAGCAPSFKRQWNSVPIASTSPDTLAGRWEGRWLSDKNGHHGKLRCIVTPVGADEYEFYYWARFWKFFTASYKITVAKEMSDDGIRFEGEQNLGVLYGGVYTHEGNVVDGKLSATYRCKIDHGSFDMSKIE